MIMWWIYFAHMLSTHLPDGGERATGWCCWWFITRHIDVAPTTAPPSAHPNQKFQCVSFAFVRAHCANMSLFWSSKSIMATRYLPPPSITMNAMATKHRNLSWAFVPLLYLLCIVELCVSECVVCIYVLNKFSHGPLSWPNACQGWTQLECVMCFKWFWGILTRLEWCERYYLLWT